MDFLVNVLGLQNWHSAEGERMCACCKADRSSNGTNSWVKVRGPWRNTVVSSHATWLAESMLTHVLFLSGLVSIFHVIFDMLHVVDLGVTAHIVGNALFYLATSGMHPRQGNLEAVVADIWIELKQYYDTFCTNKSSTISNLTVSMFTDPGSTSKTFPSLRHMKAVESKNLAPAVYHVFSGYVRQGERADLHIQACLKHLVAFYEGTDSKHGKFLSDQQSAVVRKSIDDCLDHYNYCIIWAVENKRMQFNVVPKFHFWWHIGWQSQFTNPGCSGTYIDEDFVGRIAEVSQNCTAGSSVALWSKKIAEQYVMGMYARWWRMSNE